MDERRARILLVQYAGDFREAMRRRSGGGAETYYAQWYSLDAVCRLAEGAEEVATLCCMSDEAHDELVAPGVRSMAAGCKGRVDPQALLRRVEAFRPTHLVLRTPMVPLMRWALSRRVRLLLTLADSFRGQGALEALRNMRLRLLLNRREVEWVANHGWNASRDLVRLGVREAKVVPWDWPHTVTPRARPAKPSGGAAPQLLFVGLVQEAKGVGDVIDAVAHLARRGVEARLTVIGAGEIPAFQRRAAEAGVSERVTFRGLVKNAEIVPAMRDADLVVIPSRHAYAEGFPMTIYEALCSRSPIVASDHPMFVRFLRHEETALVYPAGRPEALAECVARLASDAALYARLSERAEATWDEIQVPFQWGELVTRWCRETPEAFASWIDVRKREAKVSERLRAP